jgi:signal transduction histidine kinase
MPLTGALVQLISSPSSDQFRTQVKITNLLSILSGFIATLIFTVFYAMFGWLNTLPVIFAMAVLFVLVLPINRYSSHKVGRTLFCLIPVWLTLFVTIYLKMENAVHSNILFFGSRFILMGTILLPALVFRLEERTPMVIAMGSSYFTTILFDPIHVLFGVGYYQLGFTDHSYDYINYIVGSVATIMVLAVFLIRATLEKSEAELLERNRLLSEKQCEIEAQHEELLQHQEELVASAEKLEEANTIVSKQKDDLEKYNVTLERLVLEKTSEIRKTNAELAHQNYELTQFSYSLSHNFRGPVARLLGLVNLLSSASSDHVRAEIDQHIIRSTHELDATLRDLTLLLMHRRELHLKNEEVRFVDEFENACKFLEENIKPEYKITADFKACRSLVGVRAVINAIFLEAITNAIKFSSPLRVLEIRITSRILNDQFVSLEIADNGLGIDMSLYKEKLFALFTRFHDHVPGKGLGLYLLKAQVGAIGGSVELESVKDSGTVLRILLPSGRK